VWIEPALRGRGRGARRQRAPTEARIYVFSPEKLELDLIEQEVCVVAGQLRSRRHSAKNDDEPRAYRDGKVD
jgi:hypothetical protein